MLGLWQRRPTGNGGTLAQISPGLVLGGWSDWSAIAAGPAIPAGVRAGQAYCLGSGSNGRLGDGVAVTQYSPSLVRGGWTDWSAIAAGGQPFLRGTGGQAYCWGLAATADWGWWHQRPDQPSMVLGGWTDWSAIAAGAAIPAGYGRAGLLLGVWQQRRLGDGGTSDRTSPSLVLAAGLTGAPSRRDSTIPAGCEA